MPNYVPASWYLYDIYYNEGINEIEIFSIEIMLNVDCTIKINDGLNLCITINNDNNNNNNCEYDTIGIIKESINPNINAINELSAILFTPYYISQTCMTYTLYDNIISDIGVSNRNSIEWENINNDNNLNKCWQNQCCTFSVSSTNTKTNSDAEYPKLSIINSWGKVSSLLQIPPISHINQFSKFFWLSFIFWFIIKWYIIQID